MTVTLLGRGAARRAIACAALLALFVPATAARAQLDTPTSPLPLFQMADRHDWVVRTTLADGSIVEGRVRDIDGTSIRLEGGRFDVADVTAVDRAARSGRDEDGGLGIGGAAVVLGVLLLAAAHGLTADSDADENGIALVLVSIVALVGVIGGLVAAVVNYSEAEWIPVWPASQEP